MVTVSFRNLDIEERSFSVTVADVDCGPTLPVNRLTHCFTAPGKSSPHALHSAVIFSIRVDDVSV